MHSPKTNYLDEDVVHGASGSYKGEAVLVEAVAEANPRDVSPRLIVLGLVGVIAVLLAVEIYRIAFSPSILIAPTIEVPDVPARVEPVLVRLFASFAEADAVGGDSLSWSFTGFIYAIDNDSVYVATSAHNLGLDEIRRADFFGNSAVSRFQLKASFLGRDELYTAQGFRLAKDTHTDLAQIQFARRSIKLTKDFRLLEHAESVGRNTKYIVVAGKIRDQRSGQNSYSIGRVTSVDSSILETDAVITQQSSGGPVLDRDARLVGIATASKMDPNKGHVVLIDQLAEMSWTELFPATPDGIEAVLAK